MWFNIWIVGILVSMPLLAEEAGQMRSPLICMFWPIVLLMMFFEWRQRVNNPPSSPVEGS